jgi:Capsule assembly protein Wzi
MTASSWAWSQTNLYGGSASSSTDDVIGSTYVPIDNWIYPALDRLQALNYVDTAFLGLRPWTRASILAMLDETALFLAPDLPDQTNPADKEALAIYFAVKNELQPPPNYDPTLRHPHIVPDSVYVRALGIDGTPLRDSFHLGQTIAYDYGRPYEEGFNALQGFSARSEAGRFALYVRGEYQHAPSAPGYSASLAETLSAIDNIPFATNPVQATIPEGPISAQNNFRILEANLFYRIANHEISFGKSDHWMGPAAGGSFAWSNNAENIYSFQIDRTEPLYIPYLSALTGPFRYQFYVGSLKGHSDPNDPWIHVEKVSFKPTSNVEFGFSRSVIWGGEGHVPITIHSFLKSFFSVSNVPASEKFSRNDPGARFSSFDFSYRLPFLRNWMTLYSDTLVHDDISAIDAPRRAGIRPGLYLVRFPKVPKLDLRVEAGDTDPDCGRSTGGAFLYAEGIQLQGYTNKGLILGDVAGRESKGGQAWLTYHLSPREQVQLSYRNAKTPLDFIPGGTTQNIFQASVVKRIHQDFEVNSLLQYERWKAPIYKTGGQNDIVASVQVTWYPHEWK